MRPVSIRLRRVWPPLQRDQGPMARRPPALRAATCRSAFDCPAVAFREPNRLGRSDRCRPLQWAPTPASIVRAHKSRRAVRQRIAQATFTKSKWLSLLNLSGNGRVSTRPARDSTYLPAIVRERLVRVRHAVGVFFFLYRVSFATRRENDLRRQLLGH